ncbi:MAG: hypothetical protein KGZ97_12115 [Bacteroidetes bacterium]|nr:hypothetical protein [Bacteroidota bacterium]
MLTQTKPMTDKALIAIYKEIDRYIDTGKDYYHIRKVIKLEYPAKHQAAAKQYLEKCLYAGKLQMTIDDVKYF